jgi:predicted amino acid-binding ACT domain protein
MAVTVKKITLWRKEVANHPGVLADVLSPLAGAGANLRVVMGYALPGLSDRAAIEVYPVSGKKVVNAAGAAGLSASPIPCLLVEGDDRMGLGADMARGMAERGVNVSFLMAETVGRKFSAIFGFESDADAATAAKAIKAAAKRKR